MKKCCRYFLRMGVWKFFLPNFRKKKNIFLSIAVPIFFYVYWYLSMGSTSRIYRLRAIFEKRRLFQIEKYYNSNRARFAWKIRFFLTDVGNIFSCKLRFRFLREATPVSTYSVLALEVESDFYLPYIFPVYMRVCARKKQKRSGQCEYSTRCIECTYLFESDSIVVFFIDETSCVRTRSTYLLSTQEPFLKQRLAGWPDPPSYKIKKLGDFFKKSNDYNETN